MFQSNNPSLRLFIERLTARSVLSDDEKQAIMALPARVRFLSAGRNFIHENQESSYCSMIVSGLVGRFGQTANGGRQITAFHIPGDIADLNATVRPMGVGGLTALCGTKVLQIPHDALRALAAGHPAIAEAFWRDCMLDAAVLMEWVVNVGRRNAQTRLAHLLCEMSIRSSGDREIKLTFPFPITQYQLADATGMTSVHVNRSLMTLRDKGLVTVKGGNVCIHDWEALASAGEFDASYLVADTGPERRKRLPATS